MKPMRPLYLLLFVFALLFTQQGAVVHALSHTLAEQKQDSSLPQDKVCDLCAVYAQIGSAIASSPVAFAAVELGVSLVPVTVTEFHSPLFAAFAARAPPCSA